MSNYIPPLRWRHNDHAGVSNHQPHGCLLNRLFRRKSKKTSKLRVTGLCAGNSPGTGEFPAQMASCAENVSIWWRHHALLCGYELYTVVVLYFVCSDCLTAVWLPIGMRHHGNQLCLLLIGNWAGIKQSFTSTAMVQIYLFLAKLIPSKEIIIFQYHLSNNVPVKKTRWSQQVETKNNFLPGATWAKIHNLIGWFFVTWDFIGCRLEYRVT